jgi:EF hand
MKAALITAALSAAMIASPAVGQPAPSGDEHSAHYPQTAQVQAPSQGQGRTPGMMGGSGQQGQGGMMQPGMMGPDMMQPGMMGAMPMMAMHGRMMKVMFAIADANGDGALAFEEVTAVHKRVFDVADANKDGKVTLEEMQAFFRE